MIFGFILGWRDARLVCRSGFVLAWTFPLRYVVFEGERGVLFVQRAAYFSRVIGGHWVKFLHVVPVVPRIHKGTHGPVSRAFTLF